MDAAPIARGQNITLETLLSFVYAMPKENMPKSQFHQIAEARMNGWTRTHSQIARQMALYYEEGGICYPRFLGTPTIGQITQFAVAWASLYYAPNPYTPSLVGRKPVCLYSFLRNEIESGNKQFKEACFKIYGTELNNIDKVRAFLNSFSDIVIDNNTMNLNDGIISSNKFEVYPQISDVDSKKEFFYHFSDQIRQEESSASSSYVPLSTLDPASLTSFNQQLLSAIRTKPFVLLAGISGTGKSRIVRELARCCWADDEEQRNAQEPKNFMMIQVRPNWHDSTELIGYVSRINGEKYIAGDFIKFVARAWQDPGRPYFLCLDEMNLAPVEQYFAEYLSIIESRKLKNGKIVTDAIISPDYKSVDGEKIVKEYYDNLIKELIVECPDDKKHALYIQFKTDGISIPQNLIVIGTVNMDETTYSFSRKVLDRAMTLEMNEVDMWGGLVDDESFNFGNLEDILANAVSDEKVAYQQDKELCDKVLEYLENVNSKLEGTPFKIAYRTRNEFLMYALNRKSLAKDDDNVYVRTIDEMTSMKILSRIEGDFEKTSNVLKSIKDILKGGMQERKFDINNSISLKKIDEMEKKLKSGYTSYWA